MKDIREIFSQYSNKISNKNYLILVKISNQSLILYKDFEEIKKYKVSTSIYGEGSDEGSNKTPLGAHYIKDYIGKDIDFLTIFQNRKPINKKTEIIKEQKYSDQDIISSRILWLEGLEEGKNKGVNVDTYQRYIYIHGTNEESLLGKKASHGCIRMSNNDIITLCNFNINKAFVYITPEK